MRKLPDASLPLFDTQHEAPEESPAPEPAPGTRDRPLSIADLNQAAREMLEDAWPDVWVEGEISNLKAHPSGHITSR